MKLKFSKISIILACIYIVVFFAFTSGLINSLIEGQKYNVYQILPTRSIQNNFETIMGITILIFGFIGILAVYKANSTNKIKEKYIFIAAGLIICSISIYFMYDLLSLKQG